MAEPHIQKEAFGNGCMNNVESMMTAPKNKRKRMKQFLLSEQGEREESDSW